MRQRFLILVSFGLGGVFGAVASGSGWLAADVPNTFVNGEVATAAAVNDNFNSLDNRVGALETGTRQLSKATLTEGRYFSGAGNGNFPSTWSWASATSEPEIIDGDTANSANSPAIHDDVCAVRLATPSVVAAVIAYGTCIDHVSWASSLDGSNWTRVQSNGLAHNVAGIPLPVDRFAEYVGFATGCGTATCAEVEVLVVGP